MHPSRRDTNNLRRPSSLQLFLSVEPVDPVAAHAPAFAFEQHVHPPVAVSHTGLCDLAHAMAHRCLGNP